MGRKLYMNTNLSPGDSIKMVFPDTDPKRPDVLRRKCGFKWMMEFKQLGGRTDNDVSDFSWDKVFFIGERNYIADGKRSVRILKHGMYYDNYDVSTWKEDSEILEARPHQGYFKATTAHWPYDKHPEHPADWAHNHDAALWVVVKTRGRALGKHWFTPEGQKYGERKYIAHIIHGFRQNPPNWPATGGPQRRNGKIGEFHLPGLKHGWHKLGFNHDCRIPPIEGFIPEPGDVVGFFLSGYHNAMGVHKVYEDKPSCRNRTNIIWYEIPEEGKKKGKIIASFSDKTGHKDLEKPKTKKTKEKKMETEKETPDPKEIVDCKSDEIKALRNALSTKNDKIRELKGKVDELTERLNKRKFTNPGAITPKDNNDDDSLIDDIKNWFKNIFD